MIGALSATTLRVLLRRAFVTLYLLAFALGAAGFGAVTVSTSRLDAVVTDLQPLAQTNTQLLTDLVDAETGLRGYELTGRRTFLQPYVQGAADYPRALRTLDSLARSDPATLRLVDAEAADAATWLRVFARPVLARGRAAGTALDQRGRSVLDRFRAANAAVGDRVRALVASAQARAHHTRDTALVLLAVLLLLTVAAGTQLAFRLLGRVLPHLERLTRAVLQLAVGQRNVTVPEEGTAELIELARAVNFLSAESGRRRVEDRRRQRLRLLSADVSREIARELQLADVLERCTTTIGTAFDVDRVLLRLMEGDRLGPVVAEWHSPEVATPERVSPPAELEAYLSRVLVERGGLVSDDLHELAGEGDDVRDYFAALGATAACAAPLVVGATVVGGLSLLHARGPHHWDPEEVTAIHAVAADLARVISHAQLYESQRRLVDQLQALDRAKEDFVATVSHELRTPLTSIRGYVELLQDALADGDAATGLRMLEVVERNTLRLQDLVEDLLTLSRLEAGAFTAERVPVALASVVDAAAVAVGPQAARAGVQLAVGEVPAASVVLGDARQLERVVLNLLTNAIKFTPAGGRVGVEATLAGGEAALAVSDTGIGIPVEEQARLGERFFRASNAGVNAIPGTGLGLRIVWGLVEAHGGRVALASVPGSGTTLTVHLPLAGDPGEAAAGAAESRAG